MTSLIAVAALSTFSLVGAPLPAWEFNDSADLGAWRPNGQLANVALKDGVVSADAVDWDPFFVYHGPEFAASPTQYVLFRVKANKPGECALFWSGTFEGANGGLTEDKKASFSLKGDGSWEDVIAVPFWQAEKTIRNLRFDVYDATHFDVDCIRILDWAEGAQPVSDKLSWTADELAGWWHAPNGLDAYSGPLNLNVDDKGWVSMVIQSPVDGTATFIWGANDLLDMQGQNVAIRAGDAPRTYNIELTGLSNWKSPVVVLGYRLPGDAKLESLAIGEEPTGPPQLEVTYFHLENAPNRAGVPCRVVARVSNEGGSAADVPTPTLTVGQGLRIQSTPAAEQRERLAFRDYADFVWDVIADKAGAYDARVSFEGSTALKEATTSLTFTEPLNLPKADYVPEPQPVETDLEVCMYYFPGWQADAKWDCIRSVAPIRKPTLGYYDEGNPECVDWQIKWALENGITCFWVDWYWSAGNQHLTHWFDAYRKARYRDQLKVAIMWANHNAPNTHSPEDWRAVTQEWIDRYFNLSAYQQIDGMPVVIIWAPYNIRRDLGGSEAVKKAFDESQEMARKAGYKGIAFIAMNDTSEGSIKACTAEGYMGISTYHEWGEAQDVTPNHRLYEDVVKTVESSWTEKNAVATTLTYYPVVDTGWDSRPWHGDKSLVFTGRTPDLFEELLRKGKAFCEQNGKDIIVLGPANEWGEGSYIEPATEYDFDMYERVRKVFAKGDPATWPVNVAPSDVGRGPYDFPFVAATTDWTFDADAQGWSVMMGLGDFRAEGGALRFKTASTDPAIMVSLRGLRASEFPAAEVTMQVTGASSTPMTAQLFWSMGGAAMTEATAVHVPLQTDGQMHTYRLDLAANPRWRGRISTLRFDPCSVKDVEVVIDEFKMVK